ncbi:hypothetical protein Tco_0270033 [Tanacetum coccineum]
MQSNNNLFFRALLTQLFTSSGLNDHVERPQKTFLLFMALEKSTDHDTLHNDKTVQSKPKLYVADIIVQTNPIVIPDSEETLALAEESHSKMLSKHKDNMMLEKEKQVDTTPIDYNSVNSSEPTLSIRPTNVEVPKELPKVSMVNTSLKKLKHHHANFDVEKALAITALKDELRKLKGKALVDQMYQTLVNPELP